MKHLSDTEDKNLPPILPNLDFLSFEEQHEISKEAYAKYYLDSEAPLTYNKFFGTPQHIAYIEKTATYKKILRKLKLERLSKIN